MGEYYDNDVYVSEHICLYCRLMDTCHIYHNSDMDIVECNEFMEMDEN